MPYNLKTSSMPYKLRTSSMPYNLKTSSMPYNLKTSSMPYNLKTSSMPCNLKTSSMPYNLKTSSMPYKLKTSSMPYSLKTSSMPYKLKTSSMPYNLKTSSMPYKLKTSSMPYNLKTSSMPYNLKTSSMPYNLKTSSMPYKLKTSSMPYKLKTSSMPYNLKTSSMPYKLKTSSMPYKLKKQVAEACLFTTILYACETWFCENFKEVRVMYMKLIKVMLSARRTSCNDICLIESGMLPLKDVIDLKRNKYIKQIFRNLNPLSPLQKSYELVDSVQTKSARMINTAINSEVITPDIYKEKLVRGSYVVRGNSDSSKRITYKQMNPSSSQHKVYESEHVPVYMRISFIRFRLSSHELNIEKGVPK